MTPRGHLGALRTLLEDLWATKGAPRGCQGGSRSCQGAPEGSILARFWDRFGPKIDPKIDVVFRTDFWRLLTPNFEDFLVSFLMKREVKSDATTVAKRRLVQLKIMKNLLIYSENEGSHDKQARQ